MLILRDCCWVELHLIVDVSIIYYYNDSNLNATKTDNPSPSIVKSVSFMLRGVSNILTLTHCRLALIVNLYICLSAPISTYEYQQLVN